MNPPIDASLAQRIDQIVSSINALDQQHSNDHVKSTVADKTAATLSTPLCPRGPAENPQRIRSGTITLASNNQLLGKISNYFVPFESPEEQNPQSLTLLSMSQFNSMFKDAISFNIQKTKSNQTGFSFEFRTDSNNLWNNMKLNFLSTTRTDLEIGATTFDLSSKLGTPGYVTYPLRQAWNNLDSLKIVTFLSAFTGLTSGSSIGFLITDQYIQKDILILKYSAQQNTTISKITLDIVIFDMFNGAFRFEYGLFTETFLTSTKTTSLPPVIDGEERIQIAGLRDFVVETNTQFSLLTSASAFQNTTVFKYGPASDGCYFNYLSLSYLFLSISPCGFCKGTYFIYNQTCSDKCPHGTKPAPGSRCTPIVCPNGTYLSSNNECAKCPRRSNIPVCGNACNQQEYLQGEDCYPKCTASLFQSYFNGKCVCSDGYYNISGICGLCPEGTSYNVTKRACVSICLVNQHYNLTAHACECNSGLYYIGIRCGVSSEGYNYANESRSCVSKCSPQEVYLNGTCMCSLGAVRARNQTCIYCSQGTRFDNKTEACISVCGQNQAWVGTRCVCKPAFYLLGQVCGQCPSSQLYNPTLRKCRLPCLANQLYNDLNDSCYCKATFNSIASQCICPLLSGYDSTLDRCVCQVGYTLSQSLPYICLSICKQNQIFSNGRCICNSGFYLINGKCTTCPTGTIYDHTNGICRTPCRINQQFDILINKCTCLPGYAVINGYCGQCDVDQTYEANYQKCIKKCPEARQIYNSSSGLCQCEPGYHLIDRQCQKCPTGQFYLLNNGRGKCYKECGINEQFNTLALRCQCAKGYYNISGVCSGCSNNMFYSPLRGQCVCIEGYGLKDGKCMDCGPCSQINPQTGACQCAPGFFLIKGICSTCPISTVYNPQTQSCLISCPQNSTYNILKSRCECKAGYYLDYDSNKCIQTCPQGQYFVNGQCKCINPRQVLYNSKCHDLLNCPVNSYFHVQTYCCLCKAGYRLNNGSCLPFSCGNHSYDYNGICVCQKGFYMIYNQCRQCNSNEVYNGVECVCLQGYTKNQKGQCVPISIPICDQYEVYNYTLRQCVCIAGFQFLLGKCQKIPQCPIFSNWNGVSCVCQSGYIMVGKVCSRVNNTIPSCPRHSEFNGVSCTCQEGYYQIKPGSCGVCPQGSFWNGNECSLETQCDVGFVISPFNSQCIPVGQLCGPGTKWNGASCCCLPGYNNIGQACVQCPAGTYFDGKACSSSPNAANSCSSNEIYVNGQCQCIEGFHRIHGACTGCPQFTYWNGAYCEYPQSDPSKWCLGIPFSIQAEFGCECQAGYLKLNGLCVHY